MGDLADGAGAGGAGPGRRVPVVLEAFSSLQSLLLSAKGHDEFLGEVARLATAVGDPPASCGITTRRDGRPLTLASSDAVAQRVDEVQYGAGDGPCLQSLQTGAVIDVPDLRDETRWPGYREHALAQGVLSSLSLPLSVNGQTIGALNLYGFRPRAFSGSRREHAEVFARQASTAIMLMLRQAEFAETSAELERALVSRSVIDQATGVLMAQQQCTAEEAFALLRTHSQNNNRKLRDVAADIITRLTGHAPVPPRAFQRRDADQLDQLEQLDHLNPPAATESHNSITSLPWLHERRPALVQLPLAGTQPETTLDLARFALSECFMTSTPPSNDAPPRAVRRSDGDGEHVTGDAQHPDHDGALEQGDLAAPQFLTSAELDGHHGRDAEMWRMRQELAGLQAAMASRATIEQAKGVLIGRYHCSEEIAFGILARWSQRRNIKLRVIAQAVIDHYQSGRGDTEAELGHWIHRQLAESLARILSTSARTSAGPSFEPTSGQGSSR